MMGWKGAREAAKQYGGGGGGGMFVKLKDGDRITVLFGGTPHICRKHWDESEGRSVHCDGGECCDLHGPARSSYLSYCHDDKGALMVWEMSHTLFEMISEELEDEGFDSFVQVKRKGERKNTRYSVTARGTADKRQIKGLMADIEESEPLTTLGGKPLGNAPNAAPLDDDDVPF
jgi:hypothetical protein